MSGADDPSPGTILVVGLSRETAPLHIRERASLDGSAARALLRLLKDTGAVDEAVALCTCNRTEIYAVVPTSRAGEAPTMIREMLSSQTSIAREELVQLGYVRLDREAVEHLFGVVAGLNSTVLGELEIIGQARAAVALAAAEGTLGPLLEGLFAHAASCGRRVRAGTSISRGAVSVCSIAVDLADALLDGLRGRRVLILGAGTMARAAAQRVAGCGAREIVVANRSARGAAELARRIGGRAVALDRVVEEVAAADLVVCATGAPRPILSRGTLLAATSGRRQRRLVVLDLAVPRDVDPATHDLPDVVLRDIDEIQRIAAARLDGRRRELPRAWTIVRSEATRFEQWRASLPAEPILKEIRRRAEEVRQAELDRVIAQSSGLSDAELQRLELVTASLLNKLLHEPTVRMRRLGLAPGGRELLSAIGELFALSPSAEPAPRSQVRARTLSLVGP